jgi:hypothetical protein
MRFVRFGFGVVFAVLGLMTQVPSDRATNVLSGWFRDGGLSSAADWLSAPSTEYFARHYAVWCLGAIAIFCLFGGVLWKVTKWVFKRLLNSAAPSAAEKEWKNVSGAIELFAEGSLRKTRDKCEAKFIEASGKVHEAENQVGDIRIKYANVPYGAEEANARNAAHDKLESYGIYLNQAKYELTSAWDALSEEIHKKLCRGELVAKGFRVPHVGGNTEIEILPAEWRVLLLDGVKSEAIRKNDGGTVYTEILVSKT